jgi:sodium/potassium/calcium exchanger 6
LAYSSENESGRIDLASLLKNEHVNEAPSDPAEKKALLEQREKAFKRGQIEAAKRNFKNKRGTHSTIIKVEWTYHIMRHKVWNELKEIQDSTFIGKVLSVIKSPFNLVRNLTIPVCVQERWNKSLATVQPALTLVFCFWQFGLLDNIYNNKAYLALFCSAIGLFSLYIWKKSISKEAPKGLLSAILLVSAFVTSIVWINLVANIFVDFIKLLAVFTGLPATYLGLTVLAWGNSMNDLFVDSALAKKGLGQVAISGVFAGQFFNLSIGFGISLLRQAFNNIADGGTGEIDFDFFEPDANNKNLVSLILICCLLFSLFSTLIYGCLARFNLKKPYGIYLVLSYLGCFIAATLLCLVFKTKV